MKLDVEVNVAAISRELAALQPRIAERVTVSALNRAIAGVRTEAVRELRSTFDLPARSLRSRLLVRKATRARQEAAIFVRKDYDPPLYLFKPRWRRRQPGGATVQLRSGQGRTAIPGAFLGRTRYGRVAVFRRTGQPRSNPRPGRVQDEALEFLRSSDVGGPTVAKALLEAPVNRALRASGRNRFIAEARRLAARNLTLGAGPTARLRVT